MIRLFLAGAVTLMFLAGPGFADHDGGGSHGGGRDGGGDFDDRGSFGGDRGSFDDDPGSFDHDRGSFDDLHDRIDRAEGISKEDKEGLHQTVDTVKSETDKVREANAVVDKLQAQGLLANDPAEKARIEADVKRELDRIEEGRSTLGEVKRNLEAQIDASPDLTGKQKGEVRAILRDFADKRITEVDAKAALDRLRAGTGGGTYEGSFVLILVLFVIIESGCLKSGSC